MNQITLKTENTQHYHLLIELARSLNIAIEESTNDDDEKYFAMKIAEPSFAKDWSQPENDHWDKFLKDAKDKVAK